MKKLTFLFLLLLIVSFHVFSTYDPSDKEEFIFAPLYYRQSEQYSYDYFQMNGSNYLYGGFYKTLDDAIYHNKYRNNSYYADVKDGLWYWDYVMKKGYFDNQILFTSDGKELSGDYLYFSVILETGEQLVYTCLKNDKYTPADRGIFRIRPLELYKPIINKQELIPGSWLFVTGGDGNEYLYEYTLNNGDAITTSAFNDLNEVAGRIKDDSLRYKFSELIAHYNPQSLEYDEEQSVIWVSSWSYIVALISGKLDFYFGLYIGDSEYYIIPRVVLVDDNDSIQGISLRYGNNEWDLSDIILSGHMESSNGYTYYDSWIGEHLETFSQALSMSDIKTRIKYPDDYSIDDMPDYYREDSLSIINLCIELNKYLESL